MNIKPHTMNDLDRYGPVGLQPLPLSSPVWDGAGSGNTTLLPLDSGAAPLNSLEGSGGDDGKAPK
jgi:hypothetical protein